MNQVSMGQPLDEFDYSIDQSTRVERRVADGVYRLMHGGQDIGEEVWGIFGLRNGSFRLMTEIDQQWPVSNQQRANLDLDDRWRIRGLWAEVDLRANRSRRIATYVPSDDQLSIQVVEAHVHDDEEHGGRSKTRNATLLPALDAPLPRINPPTGKTVFQREVPFSDSLQLDFASALFNFVVLQQLQLTKGSQATFDSIVLTLPSLEPLSVRQTYSYERDEPLGKDANQPPARRYTITEVGASDAITTFWTDAHGIVIKQSLLLEGAPHGCELVGYRWQN